MALKLPKIPKFAKEALKPIKLMGLPVFEYKDVMEKIEIGRGGFATASVATYQCTDQAKRVVVVKDMHNLGEQGKKLFVKEAKLLNGLRHENIVQFIAGCRLPPSIKLEYVYFDFKPFEREQKVSSLDNFLREIHNSDGFDHVYPVIASDISKALEYLHQRDIVHRDLKPGNIFISNQHYCDLTEADVVEKLWSEKPFVCKVTDFGESRSNLIHTQSLTMAGRSHAQDPGTPAFMAPEIFLPERAMKHHATLELLKKADILALGLTFYSIVNPSLSAPYVHDLMKANVQAGNYQKHIQEMLRRQELPTPVPENVPRQATVWRKIFEMFELCAKFDPECKPNASQVMEKLRSGIPKTTCLDTHL